MHAVAPVLAPYVSSLLAYDSDRGGPGVHLGLPSPLLTLVLAVGDPLDVGWVGTTARARHHVSVSGLHTRAAKIRHHGRMVGVQVGLTVAGARALLGVPAAALAGEVVDGVDLAAGLPGLVDRVAAAAPQARAGVVEQALFAALSRHDPGVRAELGHALALLTRGHRVGAVADEVGYSRRHLGQLVRAETGVAPKELARLARFDRAVALARTGRRWAEVAARSGYADQAHLSREWTALAGCSPTAWAREELPFVQDDHGPRRAS